jgi:NADH:ubiquinone oxidoreductase subunit 3 (subunit A)
MQSVYIALIIFAVLAAIVPISMIITTKLLSPKVDDNDVKSLNYESAEESTGEEKNTTNEYIAYFPAFLAFEFVCAGIVLWSFIYTALQTTTNEYVLAILVSATIISLITTIFIQKKEPRVEK